MQLANLESREVLLAKIAGAMKASMAKAARTFDALRIKMEAGAPVSEPEAKTAEAVVDAPVAEATPEVVTEVVVEAPAETPAEGTEN
jgi:large subunit ribosomal protein L10